MIFLLAASLLWAFSFGLIKGQLTGVDPALVSLIRLALATLAFCPFLLKSKLSLPRRFQLMALGAIQFGLMYVLYISSFQFLPAWLVALFTIFTPIYVVLLAGLRSGWIPLRYVGAALLAVAGAGVVVAKGLPDGAAWKGVLLLQGANLSFAVGQVYYADLKKGTDIPDHVFMAWMYLGSLVVPLVWGMSKMNPWNLHFTTGQISSLLYLGLVPTGLGFYLWNKGAARVQTGILAVANNLKVPLAVAVSWLIFGEEADYLRVLAGLVLIIAGLILAGRSLPEPEKN